MEEEGWGSYGRGRVAQQKFAALHFNQFHPCSFHFLLEFVGGEGDHTQNPRALKAL
jgi:hypothetical protein